MEEAALMLEVIQQYQLATYRNKYADEEMQKLFNTKELQVLQKNKDLLRDAAVLEKLKEMDSFQQDPTNTPEAFEAKFEA